MNFISWFYTLRSYIDSYLGFMKGRPFWTLIWVVAICCMVWFFGPSVTIGNWRPLEPEFNRICTIATIIVGWLFYVIVNSIRKRQTDKTLIGDLTEDDHIDPEIGIRDEVDQLQTNLKDALLKMKAITKKRFNYVYEFPWYMIIGAPGSGKTTALLNSGLDFPLGEDVESIKGIGGTRNCDWWFTDDAILIDTAGRYTTQDSDATVDGAAWHGFLDMLKRYRPLKPVNGVIVTLSIEDLLTQSPQSRLKEIRTIRQRLRDLEEKLKVSLPIYLIFTKVDVIPGFGEFFDSFNKFDREQVLGTTFPLGISQSRGKVSDPFAVEYDVILERLNRLLVERMHQEPDDARRSRVFRFPVQFAALKASIVEQVAELTMASKLVKPPILRGVYFVSATQSGQVYDKVRASLSERFSFLPEANISGSVGQKPYFLSRLFDDVIFGEANLVITDARVRRTRQLFTGLMYVLPFIVGLALYSGWTHAWFANQSTLSAINTKTASYNRDAPGITVENVADGDLVRVIEPLNNLRSALVSELPGTDRWFHVGIAQEKKLSSHVENAYNRALNSILLPRLLVYLQDGMDVRGIKAGDLYNRLKLYLMLGGLGPLDREYIKQAFKDDIAKRLPGSARAGQRIDLSNHVNALISQSSLKAITLDEQLINEARNALTAKPTATRIYEIVKQSPESLALGEWRAADKTGSGGDLLLERRSGKTLREGVSLLYTRQGFYQVVIPQIDITAKRMLSEPWVLGSDYTNGLTIDDLKRDVIRSYLQDFQKVWSDFLKGIFIKNAIDLQQATNLVAILTSKNNPLASLSTSITQETDLRVPSIDSQESEQSLNNGTLKLPTSSTADLALLSEFNDFVLDPYSDLRNYVIAEGDKPSEFSALEEVFEELFRQLSRAANNPRSVNNLFGVESALVTANQRLVSEAQRLPAPLDRWLGKMATDIARLSSTGARQSLSQLWQTTGGRFCRAAIQGRYPFVANSRNDVAINDFIRMFGPSGEFETFFKLHLKPFVDVSQSPWRWTGLAGNEAVASEALEQFEIAKKIQTAFFAEGTSLTVNLDLTPVELDSNSTAVFLSLNGQSVSYDHGPIQTKSIRWPGDGDRSVRIAFQPTGSNASITRTGPWAMFRLFDLASRSRSTGDRFRAKFSVRGRSASFDVQTGSILNPFSLQELSKFRCLERL